MARLLDRLRTLPTVQFAAAVFLRPLARGPVGLESWVVLDGQQADRDPVSENPTLNYEVGGFDGATYLTVIILVVVIAAAAAWEPARRAAAANPVTLLRG